MSGFQQYNWGDFARQYAQQQTANSVFGQFFNQQGQPQSTFQLRRVERDEAGLICRIAGDKGLRLKEERVLGFVRFVWRLPDGRTLECPLQQNRDVALICACEQLV
jgi:hypothetical protein